MKQDISAGTLILKGNQIHQKIKRIAYQILENNLEEEYIIFAGIQHKGQLLAEAIAQEYKAISSQQIEINNIQLTKTDPLHNTVSLAQQIENPSEKVVIVVDDVLNSGRTIAYALKPLLEIPLKKIETAFLVNRAHKKYPIAAEYTGMELATTIQEHIEVVFEGEEKGIYLI